MQPTADLLDALPARDRSSRASDWMLLALRVLGALSLLATGAVHLQQYERLYHAIPTIGTLFVLNFAGATGLALVLLAPWRPAQVPAAIAGIGLAVTAFTFLAISEHTPLFGFMEPGYDPPAIAAARAAEVATVLFLGAFVLGRANERRHRR